MGTRHEDQPAEHWAGAESLDPTPVWKQYVLIAGLLFGGLIAVLVVSLLAIAPQIVTPPALVPGDRLVLPIADLPGVNQSPKRIEPTVGDTGRAFYLGHPSAPEALGFRARWAPTAGGAECPVEIITTHAQSGGKPEAERGREEQFRKLAAAFKPGGADHPVASWSGAKLTCAP